MIGGFQSKTEEKKGFAYSRNENSEKRRGAERIWAFLANEDAEGGREEGEGGIYEERGVLFYGEKRALRKKKKKNRAFFLFLLQRDSATCFQTQLRDSLVIYHRMTYLEYHIYHRLWWKLEKHID